MTGLKKAIIIFPIVLLCFNIWAAEEKDRVLDNFFAKVKSLQSGTTLSIESMEANFSSEIVLSQNTLNTVQPLFNNVLQRPFSNILKGEGILRIKFKNVEGKNKAEYMYLYYNSPSIGNFIFTKALDNIEIYLPAAGIVIKDTLPEIQKILQQYGQKDISQQSFPPDIITSILSYISVNEKSIREKIQFKKTGTANGKKTYLFTYPLDNGELTVEIYDEFWTFASINFAGNDKNAHIQLKYPLPPDTASFSCLPDVITMKGEEKGNSISVVVSDIKYNRLFSENDFKVLQMNLQEFAAIMYLRYLQSKGR